MNTPTYFDETEVRIGDKVQHGLYGQCIVVGMDKDTDELDVVNVLTGEEINCLSINCDLLHRDGGFQWIRVGNHKPEIPTGFIQSSDVLVTDGHDTAVGFLHPDGLWYLGATQGLSDLVELPDVTHWMPILPVSI